MAATGDHIKALVESHAAGDDAAFYAVAMQVAAKAARQGHANLAGDLKSAIDTARGRPAVGTVTSIAQPRGDLADLVAASFTSASLRDLIVSPNVRATIERVLHEQRQRQTLLSHGFEPAHRLLLEGPPGTGKTFTASVIAHELGLPLLTVRLDGLLSKYLGETASKLRQVFDSASASRAVYLFDEFDALGAHRGGNDVGEARRILNSFLIFLEQASSESIIIAATNHRSILDVALFRRFDVAVTYELPDPAQAIEVVKRRLGALGRGVRWSSIADATTGLSHAELVKAAETAAKAAILHGQAKVSPALMTATLKSRRTAASE